MSGDRLLNEIDVGNARAGDAITTNRVILSDFRGMVCLTFERRVDCLTITPQEALTMGLVNRVTERDGALEVAIELAHQLAAFPQLCLRGDRLSAIEQWGMTEDDALQNELRHGRASISSGETQAGAARFRSGEGRGGRPT